MIRSRCKNNWHIYQWSKTNLRHWVECSLNPSSTPPVDFVPPPLCAPSGPVLNHFVANTAHPTPPWPHHPPLVYPPMPHGPQGPTNPAGFAASHQYLTWGAPYLYYIVQQAAPPPVQNDSDSEAAKPDKFTGKDPMNSGCSYHSCIMYFDNNPFKFKNDWQPVSYSMSFLFGNRSPLVAAPPHGIPRTINPKQLG